MKYAEAPGIASKAAEIIPAVDDSATETVSLRAFSFAAIRSACGNKSCNIARLHVGPEPTLPVPRGALPAPEAEEAKGAPPMGYETILYAEDGPIGTLTLNRPEDG